METKPKKSKLRFLLYLLILIFLCLYFAGKTGYYENKISSNTNLTKEAIMAFENDLKEGKAVDIKDYLNTNKINYQNKYSKLGYEISNKIDFVLNKGVSFLYRILKSLFS